MNELNSASRTNSGPQGCATCGLSYCQHKGQKHCYQGFIWQAPSDPKPVCGCGRCA